MNKLNIALLAPLTRPTCADTRGSRPKIVWDLAKIYTDLGHNVTVFGPGDSDVPCKLNAVIPQSVYLATPAENIFYQHTLGLAELNFAIKKEAKNFDIIHNHVYPEFFPLLTLEELSAPVVTTPHLYMWPEYVSVLKQFQKSYFAPIAKYQRDQGQGINWVDVVYNGIMVEDFVYDENPEEYFLFFGRIKKIVVDGKETDPKGVIDAMEVCRRAGVKLKIAGNVEDLDLYHEMIEPFLDENTQFVGPVEATGPIGFEEKIQLYKKAKGYFFLSHCDEGCPLGPLEAMACGTPVIANRRSSLPEIIQHGKTGFICEENDIDAAVEAVGKIDQIERRKCRESIEKNYSSRRMADDYLDRYNQIINQ